MPEPVSLSDVIGGIRLSDVLRAHQYPILRNRSKRLWCDGDGWSLAFDDSKGAWFDHVAGEGGGIIDLLCKIRSCSRRDAAEWVANFSGVSLSGGGNRVDVARRRAAAETEARNLVEWRDSILETFREMRDNYFHAYHRCLRAILNRGLDSVPGHVVDACQIYEKRYQYFDRLIERLLAAEWKDLLTIYRGRKGCAA